MEEIQEVLRRGDGELALCSDHADPNRLAFLFRILQPCLFCSFLRLEGLGQRRELAADVFEEEPLLSNFGHEKFIARAGAGRSNGLVASSQRYSDFRVRTSERPAEIRLL